MKVQLSVNEIAGIIADRLVDEGYALSEKRVEVSYHISIDANGNPVLEYATVDLAS